MYTNSEYKRIVKCYYNCDKNLKKTRNIYRKIYGDNLPVSIISEAITNFESSSDSFSFRHNYYTREFESADAATTTASVEEEPDADQFHDSNSKTDADYQHNDQFHDSNSKTDADYQHNDQFHDSNSKTDADYQHNDQCHVSNSKTDADYQHNDQFHVSNSKTDISTIQQKVQIEIDKAKTNPDCTEVNIDPRISLAVYSTRLDDMKIFEKDLNKFNFEQIMRLISLESKPILCKTLPKIQSYKNKDKYDELVKKVKQINDLTRGASEVNAFERKCEPILNLSEESMELYRLCKPCSVPLVATTLLNKKKRRRLNANNNETDTTDILSSIIACSKFIHRIQKFNVNFSDVYIVLKDIYLNSTEIYYMGSRSTFLSEYYVIDHIVTDDRKLSKYVKNKEIVEFNNCCWVKREQNINSLISSAVKYKTILCLLRKPHQCQRNCVCCCKCNNEKEAKDDVIVISDDTEQYSDTNNSQNNVWGKNLESNHVKGKHSVINSALAYCKKIKDKPITSPDIVTNNCNSNQFLDISIIMKSYTETYTSGKGSIHDSNSTNSVTKNVCCWYKRKYIASVMPQPIAKLISEPHRCLASTCHCCCRSNIILSKINSDIKLPTENEYFKYYRSKYIQNWKNIENSVTKLKRSCVPPKPVVKSKRNMNDLKTKIKQPKNLKTLPTQIHTLTQAEAQTEAQAQVKAQAQAQASVELAKTQAQASLELAKAQAQAAQAHSDAQAQAHGQTYLLNNIVASSIQDSEISKLVSSILERYKNIRLSVDARCRVSANINTSLDNMSDDDLKVLANILSHVQQEVNTLIKGYKQGHNSIFENKLNNPVQNSEPYGKMNPIVAVPIMSTPPVLMTLPVSLPQKMISALPQNISATLPQNKNINTADPVKMSNKNVFSDKKLEQAFTQITHQIGNATLSQYINATLPQNKNINPADSINEAKKKLDEIVYSDENLHRAFTQLSLIKTQQYRQSIKAHLARLNVLKPKIENVISLSTSNSEQPSSSGVKRKVTDKNESVKKLKVKSPSQLKKAGNPLTFNQAYYNFIHNPIAQEYNIPPVIQPLIVSNDDTQANDTDNFMEQNSKLFNALTLPPGIVSLVPSNDISTGIEENSDADCILGV